MLAKLKSMGYSAKPSYALGFISVIASNVVLFPQGGSGADEAAQAAGERFGIIAGLWAPTFMALGNGIANPPDNG